MYSYTYIFSGRFRHTVHRLAQPRAWARRGAACKSAVVAPGDVVGIDIQPQLVEQARALAAERGVIARFDVASVYELPFPDASFDAAFAQTLLCHLAEPVRALQELRRVLRPGGVIGLREPDFATHLLGPAMPLLAEMLALAERARAHSGGDSYIGRELRRLLHEAGFVRTRASASLTAAGSLPETRQAAAVLAGVFQGVSRIALEQGWLDQQRADAIQAEVLAWGEREDAFRALLLCEAVGWVEG